MSKEENVVSRPLADECPECGNRNLISDRDSGEIICGACGLVIRQIMDRGKEWRAFSQEEEAIRSRAGPPVTYSVHDKGLSTGISRFDFDAFGKRLSPEAKAQMKRLRKWHLRSRFHKSIDRNLSQAMHELDRLTDKLIIPKQIREIAAIIYRKALTEGLTRGRAILALVPAALYVACRISGTTRTIEEITDVSLTDKKEIARCYRILINRLGLKIPIVFPVDCISKIAEPIGISGKTQGLAIEILRKAKRKRIPSGKDPMGLAAAALYIAGLKNNEPIRQNRLAEVAMVTEVTIRNRYKELRKKLGLKLS